MVDPVDALEERSGDASVALRKKELTEQTTKIITIFKGLLSFRNLGNMELSAATA